MDVLVVVPAQLLLFLYAPASERLGHVPIFVFAAHHKSNLAAGIGRNGGVGIFDSGEDFFAGFLEVGDEGKMQPLILRW